MNEDNTKMPDNPMRAEYDFDYASSQPNRFAAEFGASSVAVVLDPDVASIFSSSETVNRLLRSVIAAMPEASLRRADATLSKRKP
jgi:hypothetical protein